MPDNQNTYRKGLKGIAIFGGLQFYKILLSILTTKVSAIFLGPAGCGIYGLVSSTLTTIESFTSCGLGTSAVKDIAQAASKMDKESLVKTYTVLNKLVWITGLMGLLIVSVFAEFWSQLAFGTKEYAIWFVVLSITLLINQLTTGQGALLTGLQKYKLITKTRILVGVLSAIVVIICYSFGGVNGIIPVILGTAIINLTISYLMVRKTEIRTVKINITQTIKLGRPMFLMGISLGLSWALTNLSGYFVKIYVSHLSDVATVGLFTASFSLINTYLGLLFTSIESDYFPRLSKACKSRTEYNTTMSQEIELLMFLIIPLVGFLILFSQPVLAIFYSTKFYTAKTIICWTAFSMIFKVPSWAMSIGLVTKGKSKLYFISQVSFLIYQFVLNVLGFKFGGLTGLGISYVVSQILFSIQNYVIQSRSEGFSFSNETIIILILCIILGIPICILTTNMLGIKLYLIGGAILTIIIFFCVRGINKRTNLISVLTNKFHAKTNY